MCTPKTSFLTHSLPHPFAQLILTVEYGDESGFICFHDALYFSVVSLLTVGLGDLAPISVTGRILSTLMLIVGVALVSYQLNELEAVGCLILAVCLVVEHRSNFVFVACRGMSFCFLTTGKSTASKI